MNMSILHLNEFFPKFFHDQRWTIAEPSLARDGRHGISMAMDGRHGISMAIDGPLGTSRSSVNCTGVSVRVKLAAADPVEVKIPCSKLTCVAIRVKLKSFFFILEDRSNLLGSLSRCWFLPHGNALPRFCFSTT